MSNNAPSGDSLTRKLDKLCTAARAIEQLATDYHAAIRPVREAVQAVADVSLEDRDRWAGAFSSLSRCLSENGIADVPASLARAERWDKQFDAGSPGHAFAGRDFCAALAVAVTDGSQPTAFFAALDHHKFITTMAATREVCAVLSHLLYRHTERIAPGFNEGYGAILKEVGIDGETLRVRLAQCGMPLSDEAGAAIHDWDECSTGMPCYHATIAPPPSTNAADWVDDLPADERRAALQERHERKVERLGIAALKSDAPTVENVEQVVSYYRQRCEHYRPGQTVRPHFDPYRDSASFVESITGTDLILPCFEALHVLARKAGIANNLPNWTGEPTAVPAALDILDKFKSTLQNQIPPQDNRPADSGPPREQGLPTSTPPTGSTEREEGVSNILDELPESARLAIQQYRTAVTKLTADGKKTAKDVTDEDAYAFLKGEDMELPSFDTWTRYLRGARKSLGIQKKKRRPAYDGRSAVPPEHFATRNDD